MTCRKKQNLSFLNISYNKNCLLKDGRPWFPFMGEFHFSRYPASCWEQEIRKMKAGGVNIISTYIFWIHHEETEGSFDFSGQRNLRHFLELCQKWDMPVFLRPGPWVHAETRNGGFPDWLMQKGWELRTDDQRYLKKVSLFWEQVYLQIRDYLDIIIGIQIENEYGHVGGLRGEAGNRHIRTLTDLARKIGFRACFWTASGWGGAVIGDLIPVMSAYCDAPWISYGISLPPNRNYLFSRNWNDGNLHSDTHLDFALSFSKENYPYLMAELGGGIQITHHRRPLLREGDIPAMAMVKLGSGCNLLGFYMYHGGTNPTGKLSTYQESISSGGFVDLPVYNYDFQAPIREYGQITDTMKELKLLSMFVSSFGADLCEMDPVFDPSLVSVSGTVPEGKDVMEYGESQDASDLSHIRAVVRKKDDRGYLFINNFQRLYPMEDHRQVSLRLKTGDLDITWPARDIDSQTFFFLPFHFPLGETRLNWISQTPLTKLGSHVWIFYGDEPLQLDTAAPLKEDTILSLSREAAKNCWKIPALPEGIFISEAPVLETRTGGEVLLRSDMGVPGHSLDIDLFLTEDSLSRMTDCGGWNRKDNCQNLPSAIPSPAYMEIAGNPTQVLWFQRTVPVPVCQTTCQWTASSRENEDLVFHLNITYDRSFSFPEEEVFLRINYAGDSARLYLEDQCVADQFYIDGIWEIGLGRYGFPQNMILKIHPLSQDDPVYLDHRPDFQHGTCCHLTDIQTIIQTKEEVF